MLDSYDRARQQAKAHEIEIHHGNVAEAATRKWLKEFLPKKYGVTSGYVISPGIKSSIKAPHFDVIIYDQINSPVLWVEDSPDSSQQGRALAIPAEYVHSVLEVKAALTSKSAGKAIDHLNDLSPLLAGQDDPTERYKLHLPPSFCCGTVFFELRKEHQYHESSIKKLVSGARLRGFFGGIILRGEGHAKQSTGGIKLLNPETEISCAIGKGKQTLLNSCIAGSTQVADNVHLCASLFWAEHKFSEFGFDLIAMMQGTYDPGRVSSFYGFGQSAL